jgi:hypothetical protein
MEYVELLQNGDKIAFKINNTSDREIHYELISRRPGATIKLCEVKPKSIYISQWHDTGCTFIEKIYDYPLVRSNAMDVKTGDDE